ncbi:MAG: hypothetical protein R6X31_13890 [Anaerolineae bacterium]
MTTDERAITVPGAPSISGLAFRRFRGEPDYPIMVAILNACDAADGLDHVSTMDEIAHAFAHLRNCDSRRDMLLAEIDGETVAFSRVSWSQQGTGERLYKCYGFVHPD